jgi:hypothetical protein
MTVEIISYRSPFWTEVDAILATIGDFEDLGRVAKELAAMGLEPAMIEELVMSTARIVGLVRMSSARVCRRLIRERLGIREPSAEEILARWV